MPRGTAQGNDDMAKISPTLFREYDIRGLVDQDLTEEAVFLIGKALGTKVRVAGGKNVVVGRDCRESGERFSRQLVAALRSTGCDVIDVGVVPTPLVYFAAQTLDADGLCQITGSHNPPEYNGLKLGLGKSTFHGEEIQELRRIVERGEFATGEGGYRTHDVVAPYRAYVKENLAFGKRRLKVVVDAGNGTGGVVAVPLFQALGLEVVPLFIEMDGRFPNHHADPTVEKNLEHLKAKVREVKCSMTLYDDIARHGGRPIMWKAGHSLIKAKMKEERAQLAGEMSGHIFFANRWFGFDDGIYSSARLLELLTHSERPLSTLLADVPKTCSTPELRVDCPEDKKFTVVRLAQEWFKARYDAVTVDGVRVVFPDGWGLVRASNTQPLLVLRFEARTPQRLTDIEALVRGRLNEILREVGA